MNSFKEIKLKKLREYLKNYHHFETLSDQEKLNYSNQLAEMDLEKQEEILNWLLYEEEIEKSKILNKFKAQVDLLGSQLKISMNKLEEGKQALDDQLEEIELQKNIT
jgi:hypothetical protein